MPRNTRLIAAIASAVLLAGCGFSGTSATTVRGGAVDTLATKKLTDDSDIGGPMRLKGNGLVKEAVAGGLGNHIDFKTLIISPMTGRSVLPKGEGPVVAGQLKY